MTCPAHIIVDNLPAVPSWYIELGPIFIAVVAVVVSLISLYYSRREYINSIRPFVWVSEFAYLNAKNEVTPVHSTVMLKVLNAPAKIRSSAFKFEKISSTESVLLLEHNDTEFYRYPDSGTQWTFNFNEFSSELGSLGPSFQIQRDIRITYEPLSGNQQYFYHGRAKFLARENKWEMIEESAN